LALVGISSCAIAKELIPTKANTNENLLNRILIIFY